MADLPFAHPTDDQLLELALDRDSDPRGVVLRHVHSCPQCRALYDDFARVLDATLSAGPAVEPPAGFESRAPARPGEAGPDAAPRPRPRLLPIAAAAAVAGLLVGSVGVALLRQPDPSVPSSASAEHRLRTSDGEDVGSVRPSSYQGRDVLVIAVDNAKPGTRYACMLELRNGTTLEVGTWTVPASGHGTWVTPLSGSTSGVQLVATTAGKVWATAELDG